jgi:6-phosphofructokinase 1
VRAAIVTCGGLCPGLNNIIQGLVRTLKTLYGAESVIGVRGGYQGFGDDPKYAPVPLCVHDVIGFQNEGGTEIGSGRGSFDLDKTIAFLEKHGINQLYVVGGDGTHRAANKIANEAKRLRLNIAVRARGPTQAPRSPLASLWHVGATTDPRVRRSARPLVRAAMLACLSQVCGVPKTIDNDIDLLDRSFGFNTAVEEAQAAILSAKTEAKCNLPNGTPLGTRTSVLCRSRNAHASTLSHLAVLLSHVLTHTLAAARARSLGCRGQASASSS